MMNNKDWLLLAISFSNGDYISPAQLQKSLFLLREEKPRAVGTAFYKFIPYNYGPFCKDIYSDVDKLIENDLVKFGRPVDEKWQGYSITDNGKKHLSLIEDQFGQENVGYLSNRVAWVRSLTFRQLLSEIYKKYPKYKTNSVFSNL